MADIFLATFLLRDTEVKPLYETVEYKMYVMSGGQFLSSCQNFVCLGDA